MNKAYKVVYNESTGTYVAVSELETSKGKATSISNNTTRMRTTPKGLKPFVMTNLKTLAGLDQVVAFIEERGMLTSA